LQVACRTPFIGGAAASSRKSAFAGAKISAKVMRTAARKSAVAAQAKVSINPHPMYIDLAAIVNTAATEPKTSHLHCLPLVVFEFIL